MNSRSQLISVALAMLFLCGCSSTERDWKHARTTNSVEAYKQFIAIHPRGAHVDEANAAIENLDWENATTANTSQAYLDFIANHPRSARAAEASSNAENLDWAALKPSDGLDPYAEFYKRHPTSSRFQKLTGNLVGTPVLPFMNGIGFAVTGSVAVGEAVATVRLDGKVVGDSLPAEEAGRLGLIEYRLHGKSADVAAKTLKGATLVTVKAPDGKMRIVALIVAAK